MDHSLLVEYRFKMVSIKETIINEITRLPKYPADRKSLQLKKINQSMAEINSLFKMISADIVKKRNERP